MMQFEPDTYHQLMLKYLDEQATPEEVAMLRKWINASPDHRHQYEQLKRVWTLTSDPPTIPRPDKTRAWNNVATRAKLRQATDRPPMQGRTRSRRFNPAWLVLPILVIGLALVWLFTTRPPSMVELATAQDEIRTITLPDSTLIRLHGGSVLRYSPVYNEKNRDVQLAGEAYFEVTHSAIPFTVASDAAVIRVLGTRFSVRAEAATSEIVVTEGRVRVVSSQEESQTLELGAGQGATVTTNDISLLDELALEDAQHWIAGVVAFDATPFPEAIERLSRIWGTSITLSTPDLASETVTGSVRLENIPQALETLCLTLGNACSVREADDAYFIF